MNRTAGAHSVPAQRQHAGAARTVSSQSLSVVTLCPFGLVPTSSGGAALTGADIRLRLLILMLKVGTG